MLSPRRTVDDTAASPGCADRSTVATPRASFMAELARAIGARTEQVLIPWDCADGFFEACQRRAEAYLDDHVGRGVSAVTRVGPEPGSGQCGLRDDLASGRWAERNRDLVALDAANLGLRLLVT
jgi:hypothetical protein